MVLGRRATIRRPGDAPRGRERSSGSLRRSRAVVVDASFAIKCRFSALVKRPEGRLFGQLLDMFEFYEGFEVDDQTGMPLTAEQVDAQQYTALQVLQRNAFKYYSEELRDFALSPVGAVRSRDALLKHLGALPTDTLLSVAKRLQLLTVTEETAPTLSRRFVLEVLLRRQATTDTISRSWR